MTIALQPITADNWRTALALSVDPQQQRFVAEYAPIALVALAKAYVRPGGRLWLPYALEDDGRLVGFVQLAHDSDPSEVWLYHFFIDRRFQGQGRGTAALGAALNHIRATRPDCRRVCLTVHPDNHAAQRLYHAAGFRATGAEIEGEPIYCLTVD